MILLIDNYDSFAHNLARYFVRLGASVRVERNDAVSVAQIRQWQPHAIVLSPGPCTPNEAGCSLDVVRACWRDCPILGVCLGHQTIVAAFGGMIARAPQPVHGRASPVWHDGQGVFAGIPNPCTVGRYHSLVATEHTIPDELVVCARTFDGIVMAVRHRARPVVGVQFHPESVLTEHGYQLLANFLQLAGLPLPARLPSLEDERYTIPQPERALPRSPLTF